MEEPSLIPEHPKNQDGETIELPLPLTKIPPATEFLESRHRWNTNEEIASILIAFDHHKEWQMRELKIRPPSGSMMLYNRKTVRYRKDGYCWKKRKDAKTIREDHMKLKVQGVECIYGLYVHSAILPTFHRRCYWLLQNTDIVLVHYLNVPCPTNTKLSIPVMSYDKEKKEWTKEELVDQLRPMFNSGRPGEHNLLDDVLESVVQQTVDVEDNKAGPSTSHLHPSLKNPHSKTSRLSQKIKSTLNVAHNQLNTLNEQNIHLSQTQGICTNQLVISSSSNSATAAAGNADINPTSGPLILNVQGGSGVIIVSGQSTHPISILNNSLTSQLHSDVLGSYINTADRQTSFPSMINTLPIIPSPVVRKTTSNQNQAEHISNPPETNKSSLQMQLNDSHLHEQTTDIKRQTTSQNSLSLDNQHRHHATRCDVNFSSHFGAQCFGGESGTSKDNSLSVSDNCDTLDGSFSSFPGTDLNLEYLLDLQELDDCSDLASSAMADSRSGLSAPAGPVVTSGINISSTSLSNSLTLVDSTSCLDNQNMGSLQHTAGQKLISRSHHTPNVTCNPSESTATGSGQLSEFVAAITPAIGAQSVQIESDIFESPAIITDFSPDWSFETGGTKVLVTGPWYSSSSAYSCLFDGKSVPATLVQFGVLRCFTPSHHAGQVMLQVAKDGFVISHCEVFEFKVEFKPDEDVLKEQDKSYKVDLHPEWFSMSNDLLKQLLIERLEELEKRISPGDKTMPCIPKQNRSCHGDDEKAFVCYCEELAKLPWLNVEAYPKAGRGGMTLLHLAAALGYAKLITTFIRWRSDNPSLVFEYEVDAHSVDNHACTPLMWACAKGNTDASLTLYHWNSGPLKICNKDGQLPLTIAQLKGHHNLADQIKNLETNRSKSSSFPSATFTSPETLHISHPEIESTNFFTSQEEKNNTKNKIQSLHVDIPPPLPYQGESKLVRRLSEQAINKAQRKLSKRYSVDVISNDTVVEQTSTSCQVPKPVRGSNSEPHLPLIIDTRSSNENLLLSVNTRDMTSSDVLMPVDNEKIGSYQSTSNPVKQGLLVHLDTDISMRSDSPYVDVEKAVSDDETTVQDDQQGSGIESKHQMVTLANQIIAAIPERIKLSPSKDEECESTTSRARSESYSSLPSQESSHASSFGDDSGIATPMTDSLAFDEYRYTDLGTPQSSLSPDSTCLQSPYSPYSFTLDSPPPTTADFLEYFNAPSTYMEKDFSKLTLTDQEQRKLYVAAKVIQNAYRVYRDKQHQIQQRKEIEAAILIQSYYRRYKQYAYFKKMSHAAVLIQNQFRSYYAQKRKKIAAGGQGQYLAYSKDRVKKGRNQSVIIQQRYRSHYQRKSLDGKEGSSSGQQSQEAAERELYEVG
ncbi:calmodulin-binding transcription activator 1 [Patella vulgata]|uniref:calmodulin-binding transcription activator 1 n=1 Tax=Patella vulgata TaxID=6465 RepID=UPI0024A91527|nr:calmodulin-binding transcription activator 1 [Patella vulgata]